MRSLFLLEVLSLRLLETTGETNFQGAAQVPPRALGRAIACGLTEPTAIRKRWSCTRKRLKPLRIGSIEPRVKLRRGTLEGDLKRIIEDTGDDR